MRQEDRKQQRIDCDIILNKVEDGQMNICRAMNISLGGMRLKRLLEPNIHHGREFRLQFELPGQAEPIWVGAEAVYDDEKYVGVRFTSISHQHFLLLREWLRDWSIREDLPQFPMN